MVAELDLFFNKRIRVGVSKKQADSEKQRYVKAELLLLLLFCNISLGHL